MWNAQSTTMLVLIEPQHKSLCAAVVNFPNVLGSEWVAIGHFSALRQTICMQCLSDAGSGFHSTTVWFIHDIRTVLVTLS